MHDCVEKYIVLVPVFDPVKDTERLKTWRLREAGDQRVIILETDGITHNVVNARCSKVFQQIMYEQSTANKLTMFIGVDTGYYSSGNEFQLLNVGDIAVNVCQDLNNHYSAHLPANMLTQRSTSCYGVITVRQEPENVVESYHHGTSSTGCLQEGTINIQVCTGTNYCDRHDHYFVPRTFYLEYV